LDNINHCDTHVKPYTRSVAKLSVVEIFNSLQGEGVNIGKPSTFIRLAGCPLRCSWCDTRYSWDVNAGKWMSVRDIVSEASLLGIRRHVVITGGEPLIWVRRGLEELACAFRDLGAEVEVETSGVRPPSPELLSCVDYFDVSPKLPNSGLPMSVAETALRNYAKISNAWFKFVVADRRDVELAYELARRFGVLERAMVMPLANNGDELGRRLREIWFEAVKLGIRVTTRMHVSVFGDLPGV